MVCVARRSLTIIPIHTKFSLYLNFEKLNFYFFALIIPLSIFFIGLDPTISYTLIVLLQVLRQSLLIIWLVAMFNGNLVDGYKL